MNEKKLNMEWYCIVFVLRIKRGNLFSAFFVFHCGKKNRTAKLSTI